MKLKPYPDGYLRPAFRRYHSFLSGLALSAMLLFPTSSALAAETGSIAGRVYNPGTGEYVQNAAVRVEGTNIATFTGEGGRFQLNNVPAGQATVSVAYTGYQAATASVSVTDGETAIHDFNLVSTLGSAGESNSTIRMEKFMVSGEREGNAKAIMAQRSNMNISNSVASDIFGDVSEGNVGEFLKFLPGVDLEYVDAEGRSPRLGGLDPQYVGVTVDGSKIASADNFADYNGFINGDSGSGSRATGFEMMSINNIESVEISRTTSADMDADAPAGTINLKTKRAFDRKGRSITAQASITANSDDFTWTKQYRPGDSQHRLMRPSFKASYSESFLNNRLGIILGYGLSKVLVQQQSVSMTFDHDASAGDPRPVVLTQVSFGDGPKFLDRENAALNFDFKVTDELIVSLSSLYNTYAGNTYSRGVTFRLATTSNSATSGRETVLGDGLTNVTTSGASNNQRYVDTSGGQDFDKHTESYTFTPRFEYTHDWLKLDGAFTYSHSYNHYEAISEGFISKQRTNPVPASFTATRSGINSPEWTITQNGGLNWSDLRNYTDPSIDYSDSRAVTTKVYQGELNGQFTLPTVDPSFIKMGVKQTVQNRVSFKHNDYNGYDYVGPNGGPSGSFVDFPSPSQAIDTTWGGITALRFTNASLPAYISREALGQAFINHPEWFVRNTGAGDYYDAFYGLNRDFTETVPAAYVMGNTRLGKWQIQGGVRWERTKTESKEYDPLTGAEVAAAGYPVGDDGQANSNEGIDYQYGTKPRITRSGSYDDYFPSVGVKYNITPNLQLQFGFNKAIARPSIGRLSGVIEFDEEDMEVDIPNANLRPERSDNYVARLAYYFEPVGSFTLLVQQNDISNLITSDTLTGGEFGFAADSPYYNYEVHTYSNNTDLYRYKNIEVGYNQQLSFLPGALGGTSVSLTYSHSKANQVHRGLVPNKLTSRLGWNYWRINVSLGAIYTADTAYDDDDKFRKHQIKMDLSGALRLTDNLSLFFYGKNITNEPLAIYELADPDSGTPALLTSYRNYGTSWEFGIKGRF